MMPFEASLFPYGDPSKAGLPLRIPEILLVVADPCTALVHALVCANGSIVS